MSIHRRTILQTTLAMPFIPLASKQAFADYSMQPYQNLHGNSGVTHYEFGDTYIRVKFRGGSVYLYTYDSAGQENIDHMKQLATNGRGLSTFISQHVRDKYEAKEN